MATSAAGLCVYHLRLPLRRRAFAIILVYHFMELLHRNLLPGLSGSRVEATKPFHDRFANAIDKGLLR